MTWIRKRETVVKLLYKRKKERKKQVEKQTHAKQNCRLYVINQENKHTMEYFLTKMKAFLFHILVYICKQYAF